MTTATERAVHELEKALTRQCFRIGLGFRLVKDPDDPGDGTCIIKLDNKRADDKVVESHGVQVFLDPVSAANLEDYELDYIDEPEQSFFLHKVAHLRT